MSTVFSPTSRRIFLRRTACFILGLPMLAYGRGARKLRFGVISDIHQDVMHDGVERLEAFIGAMRKEEVDFIVQLGDFCIPAEKNRRFLDAWNRFPGPRYHVLGNHDMDGGFRREQAAAFLGMPARYYAFQAGGVRFIVLDGNDPGARIPGYARFIAQEQADWLDAELDSCILPAIVLIHQPLDDPAGIVNQLEVRAILEKKRSKDHPGVAAVLSGHLHQDYLRHLNGIAHLQINSASYVWLAGKARRKVYPDEIHKDHPHLENVAPYRDPLWAIVSIDLQGGTLSLKGKSSNWVGPDPWDRGADVKDYPRNLCRPAISDREIRSVQFQNVAFGNPMPHQPITPL